MTDTEQGSNAYQDAVDRIAALRAMPEGAMIDALYKRMMHTQRKLSLLHPQSLAVIRSVVEANRKLFAGQIPDLPEHAFAMGMQMIVNAVAETLSDHERRAATQPIEVCTLANEFENLVVQTSAVVLDMFDLPMTEPLPSAPFTGVKE